MKQYEVSVCRNDYNSYFNNCYYISKNSCSVLGSSGKSVENMVLWFETWTPEVDGPSGKFAENVALCFATSASEVEGWLKIKRNIHWLPVN